MPIQKENLIRKSLSMSSSSSSWSNDGHLPIVEFIDPQSKCQVVLLGCFHGTESSSKDVEKVVTRDTSVVALELCTSRFTDLKQELLKKEQEQEGDDQQPKETKPWIFLYWEMVSKTIQQRGLPTGLAAAVLGGFSGIQTALSGFTPGLEFTTALERSELYECDIVLADQDVDETLRRVGSIPLIALENILSNDRIIRWTRCQETLVRAVGGMSEQDRDIPQLQLPMVLIRNPAAIQDLVRLTVPPTIFFWAMIYTIAAIAGVDISQQSGVDADFNENATWIKTISHWFASTGILAVSYLGLALPAVGVVLTERDEILTRGIQAACQRAGEGGRVVAVLGLLHVNGVTKRMLKDKEASSYR